MERWKNVNMERKMSEINAHTIEFKKRWHIYCNINVIYIVFFCLKMTENSNSHCRSFSMCINNTFYLTQEQIFFFFLFFFFNQSTTETEEYDGGRAFRNLELIRSLFEVLNYEQQFSRVLEMPYVTFL